LEREEFRGVRAAKLLELLEESPLPAEAGRGWGWGPFKVFFKKAKLQSF